MHIGTNNSHCYKNEVKWIWGECVLFVHNTHITLGPAVPHFPSALYTYVSLAPDAI